MQEQDQSAAAIVNASWWVLQEKRMVYAIRLLQLYVNVAIHSNYHLVVDNPYHPVKE